MCFRPPATLVKVTVMSSQDYSDSSLLLSVLVKIPPGSSPPRSLYAVFVAVLFLCFERDSRSHCKGCRRLHHLVLPFLSISLLSHPCPSDTDIISFNAVPWDALPEFFRCGLKGHFQGVSVADTPVLPTHETPVGILLKELDPMCCN